MTITLPQMSHKKEKEDGVGTVGRGGGTGARRADAVHTTPEPVSWRRALGVAGERAVHLQVGWPRNKPTLGLQTHHA